MQDINKVLDTKKMLKEFMGKKSYELDYSSVSIEVDDEGETQLILSDLMDSVPGNSGLTGYKGAGYAVNKDRNTNYRPTRARGIGRDFGLYHQAFLESQAFQDGWGKIEQGMVTSHWFVSHDASDDKDKMAYIERQAQAVQDVLFGIDGGWTQHVREALYVLVAGFAPFIKIVNGFGQLAGLSFRYPSQVRNWLTDSNEQHWLGIEFDGATSQSNSYTKLSTEILLYQFRALGNDFEGISPMRPVMVYIEAHKLFTQLEGVAAEKYGAPITSVERPIGQYDKADDDALIQILNEMVAADNPTLILPGGYKINTTSPTGQMPNFEAAKRYCDEKVATILSAEGSLIGLNGKGAYNLAEIKDDQQLRSLSYYANIICSTINNKTSSGHESLIAFIVKNLNDVGGEDLTHLIDGKLPRIDWALSPTQDDADIGMIADLFSKGIFTASAEDEDWLRGKFKVPLRSIVQPSGVVAELVVEDALNTAPDGLVVDSVDGAAPIADSAMNGAQIASLIAVVSAVELGSISSRSGIEIIKKAFLMTEEEASQLMNIAPGEAPQAGLVVAEPTL